MLAFAALLQAGAVIPSGSASITIPDRLRATHGCSSGTADEVVICGRSVDRYRLPPLRDRVAAVDEGHAPGEPGDTLAAITPAAPCGIFAGERRCGKADAARYGYGDGRDPVTVLVKLGMKLADPDR